LHFFIRHPDFLGYLINYASGTLLALLAMFGKVMSANSEKRKEPPQRKKPPMKEPKENKKPIGDPPSKRRPIR